MILILHSLIVWSISRAQTTTTTCQNDPTIYKLDLRDYLDTLGPQSQISDIDPQALCDLVQSYDYVWLTQLWTPSKFNYQFNIPSLANDYKITKTIKDYVLDPTLGTSQDLIQLKQGLNQVCHHTKFLGEFSFYLGKDSSLLQNKTRFLQIPYDQISVSYNPRYDGDGFIWAVDDTGRTIPGSVVWNLYSETVITDIKDIIFRQILQQYKLDGIVFLQPSLGLYQFNIKYYQQEIQFFGQNGFLKDFYINFGLNNTIQNYFFMGGEDNLNSGQILLNQGLQVLYSPLVNTYDRIWGPTNFTFDLNNVPSYMTINERSVSNSRNTYVRFIQQALPLSQKSCFRIGFNTLGDTVVGLGIKSTIVSKNYVIKTSSGGQGVFGLYDWKILNSEDSTLDQQQNLAFKFTQNDILEIQYDPLNKMVVFRKFLTPIKYQMYISQQPSALQYMVNIGAPASYFLTFPFQFSNTYKSSSSQLTSNRQLAVSQTSSQLQFAQILPSLNLLNQTALVISIANLPANSIVGVGVCNQDLMIRNNHTWDPTKPGSGAYMLLSNGKTLHHENSLNNILTNFKYNEGDRIQIVYTPGQGINLNNQSTTYTLTIIKYIRNVNFCVAFSTINTSFYIVY